MGTEARRQRPSYVAGVAFAPSGDLVVQAHAPGAHTDGENVIARYDARGTELFRRGFGRVTAVAGNVLVSARDQSILMGAFDDRLTFGDITLKTRGTTGYLLAVSAGGDLQWSRALQQEGWFSRLPRRVALGARGEAFVCGDGAVLVDRRR